MAATPEENKAVIRQFNEALTEVFRTGGDPTHVANFMAPDVVVNVPGMPPNREGLKAMLPAFHTALSDFQMEIHDVLAEGDLVAYRVTWSGVHSGDLMGIPPTGNRVTVTETHVTRLAGGKIVEHSGDWDQMGLEPIR